MLAKFKVPPKNWAENGCVWRLISHQMKDKGEQSVPATHAGMQTSLAWREHLERSIRGGWVPYLCLLVLQGAQLSFIVFAYLTLKGKVSKRIERPAILYGLDMQLPGQKIKRSFIDAVRRHGGWWLCCGDPWRGSSQKKKKKKGSDSESKQQHSHVSLWYGQVQVTEDLQFSVGPAHVATLDRKIVLCRGQRRFQINFHVSLFHLKEKKTVWSKTKVATESFTHHFNGLNIHLL